MRALLLLLIIAVSAIHGCISQVTVDENKSSVTFLFLDDDVDGTIGDLEFTGVLYKDDFTRSLLNGSVSMESLDTDNWFRDRHLRSRKYFNNKEYPRLFFESKSVTPEENGYLVTGILTIKGISKEVSFHFNLKENMAMGTTTINAADFDILIHDDRARNEVDIKISLLYN